MGIRDSLSVAEVRDAAKRSPLKTFFRKSMQPETCPRCTKPFLPYGEQGAFDKQRGIYPERDVRLRGGKRIHVGCMKQNAAPLAKATPVVHECPHCGSTSAEPCEHADNKHTDAIDQLGMEKGGVRDHINAAANSSCMSCGKPTKGFVGGQNWGGSEKDKCEPCVKVAHAQSCSYAVHPSGGPCYGAKPSSTMVRTNPAAVAQIQSARANTMGNLGAVKKSVRTARARIREFSGRAGG